MAEEIFSSARTQFRSSGFLLGVNYWPRKSGVKMWRDFDEKEIDAEILVPYHFIERESI
ncbi:MAG: hypothetical protein ACI4UV_05555 [Victivallales bacterium]